MAGGVSASLGFPRVAGRSSVDGRNHPQATRPHVRVVESRIGRDLLLRDGTAQVVRVGVLFHSLAGDQDGFEDGQNVVG